MGLNFLSPNAHESVRRARIHIRASRRGDKRQKAPLGVKKEGMGIVSACAQDLPVWIFTYAVGHMKYVLRNHKQKARRTCSFNGFDSLFGYFEDTAPSS